MTAGLALDSVRLAGTRAEDAIDAAVFAASAADVRHVVVAPVSGLQRGNGYTVRWRVIGEDGHSPAGVFTFGAVLGSLAFGFDQTDIILFGIAANVVAGIGAAIGGRLDDMLGSRSVIIGSLIGLIVAGMSVFFLAIAIVVTVQVRSSLKAKRLAKIK